MPHATPTSSSLIQSHTQYMVRGTNQTDAAHSTVGPNTSSAPYTFYILSLLSSLNMRDKNLYPHKTTYNVMLLLHW